MSLEWLVDEEQSLFDAWKWATVTSLSPLRVRFDNEVEAQSGTPQSLIPVGELRVGGRVYVHLTRPNDPGLPQVGYSMLIVGPSPVFPDIPVIPVERLVPTGAVFPFAGPSAPPGFLLCNGQAVSRSFYADLFSMLGTTYGAGNGSTTFNVPNLVDRFPVGSGNLYPRGNTGGAATVTLTEAQMPNHRHLAGSGEMLLMSGQGQGGGANVSMASGGGYTLGYTGWTGGGAAHENLPPYVALGYIIKT